MTSLNESVAPAPSNSILWLNEQYEADPRSEKVNLGVGVYFDDEGRIPHLGAVRKAEASCIEATAARICLPDDIASYSKGIQTLLLGQDSPLIASGRLLTVQAQGGAGALEIGANYLKQLLSASKVAISNPSWHNHRPLFERAGFEVDTYPYYDAATHSLNFPAMLLALQALPEQTIVVLHACCHNPTGVDPTLRQWQQIAQVIKDKQLVPFLDIAYHGFGDGIEEDASVVRLFAGQDLTTLVSSSLSKSFSLYAERLGALTLISSNQDEASTGILSPLRSLISTRPCTPLTHGDTLVSAILNTPELYALWTAELVAIRARIRGVREQLVEKLKSHGIKQNFDFVLAQRGMFSYLKITPDQVDRLRNEWGVYAVRNGRICMAALNSHNIDYVADSIARVLS